MNPTLLVLFIFLLAAPLSSCTQVNKPKKENLQVGGGCEGCEAIYECPVAFENLSWIDTLPDYFSPGPKLIVSGIIYKADGVTPEPGVVLYIYHTDQNGIYSGGEKESGWGKQHGSIRGWFRTNEKGAYKFLTLVPGSYPNSRAPKHIHPTIKEEGFTEYYIDEFLFDNDPFLLTAERNKLENRGGNGVLVTEERNGILYAERNIYLGRNIPDYPQQKRGLQSGLELGDNCPAFEPIHLSGADKGKDACPMCKYGYGQGVMVWFNHTSLDTLKKFVLTLEKEMQLKGEKKLRVFLIYMNPTYKENDALSQATLRKKIMRWCEEQKLQKVAMLWVSSPVDENCKLYKINPKVNNTVLVYQKRKVAAKWINMEYSNVSVRNILNNLELKTFN